ncbi:MAG: penicillin-binding transpeptidase domain-containing protein, partial [Ginsengibacter sp.]
KEKIISSSTADLAKAEPLPGKPLPLPAVAPHLLQRYKSEAGNVTSLSPLGKTTIDVNLQKKVTSILDEHHRILRGNGINNACTLVLDVETGNVLAYVGNIFDRTRPELESDVDVIKAPRSPGSALKPLLYAAMFTDGTILPNSLIPDIPTQIGGYAPQNFDMKYDGAVPASQALLRSLNIPAVKLLQQYKYPRFYDLLKELGVSTLCRPADNYGLSIILGGSEVTMWDLTGIYAGMARTLNHQQKNKGAALAGDFFSPNYLSGDIHRSSMSSGKTINSLDATSIWFAFQAMEEVMRPGEEGLWQQFTSSQKIAWKTGTSFGFRDAWAIGITPEYVVAVWTGNTGGEGRPGLIGVQASAPIMFDIFRTLPSSGWFSGPQNNFSFLPVCRQSGFRANDNCPDADTVMVSKNGYRSPLCPYHQVIHLDAAGLFRVDENCEAPSAMKHQSWFILPPVIEYYYKQKNYDYKALPPLRSDCVVASVGRQMEIIYPENHAKIYVPLEIDGRKGKTIFKATHRKPETEIFWHLDNEFVATTSNIHQVGISPAPGKHVLTIVDESGERVSREFIILAKE